MATALGKGIYFYDIDLNIIHAYRYTDACISIDVTASANAFGHFGRGTVLNALPVSTNLILIIMQ